MRGGEDALRPVDDWRPAGGATRREWLGGAASWGLTAGLLSGGVARRASGAPPSRRTDKSGTTFELHATNAPFPFPGQPYTDDTVLVFVPTGFVMPSTGLVDLVWFFHGNMNTVHSAWKRHEPHRHLVRSRKNAILVAPQAAVKAHDSRAGKLETVGGFRKLTEEILGVLATAGVVPATAKPGRIVCGAHSGGFQPAAKSADLGGLPIHEMYFFDAMYGFSRRVAGWLADDASRRFVSWYAGRLPTKWTRDLLRRLDRKRVSYRHLERDSDLTRAILRSEPRLFIRTQTQHSLVTRNFQQCLETSGLKTIGS